MCDIPVPAIQINKYTPADTEGPKEQSGKRRDYFEKVRMIFRLGPYMDAKECLFFERNRVK